MANLMSFAMAGVEYFKYDPELLPEDLVKRVTSRRLADVIGDDTTDVTENSWIDDFKDDERDEIIRKTFKLVSEDADIGQDLKTDSFQLDEQADAFLNAINVLEKETEEETQKRLEAFYVNHWNYEVINENGLTRHKLDGEVVLEYVSPDSVASNDLLQARNNNLLISLILDLAFFVIDFVFFTLAISNVCTTAPKRASKDLGKSVMKSMEDGNGRLKSIWNRFINGLEIDLSESLSKLVEDIKTAVSKIEGAKKWWKETKKISFLKSLWRKIGLVIKISMVVQIIKGVLHDMRGWQIAILAANLVASIAILVATAGTSLLAAVVVAIGWLVIVIIDICEIYLDTIALKA